MIIYHNLQSVDQNLLHQIFEYCNGELYWKIKPSRITNIGDVAGTEKSSSGYKSVRIMNGHFLIHRMIFLYHHGYLPEFVDHIDGNVFNNKIENLREATKSQNLHNSKKYKNNTSGVKGVSWNKKEKKWSARIWKNNKTYYLGFYCDLKEAEKVVNEFRQKIHGEFANIG